MTAAARYIGRLRIGMTLLAALAGCSHIVVLNDPLTAEEHNDLGVVYESQNQPRLAEAEYRKALSRNSRFARARVNLGNLYAAAEQWPKAEDSYRRALRDAPQDMDALNNLAVALMHRGGKHLAEAEERALAAISVAGTADSIPRITLAEVRAARERAARSKSPKRAPAGAP